MKKTAYLWLALAALLLTGCEDLLDSYNYTQKDTSNYPKTLTDAQQVVTGIYNGLNRATASPETSFFYLSELASDDRLGGGGENDRTMQAFDKLMYNAAQMTSADGGYEYFWSVRYQGIFRANNAIATLGNCKGYTSDDQKNQMMGEVYFFRAFYYYELASYFGQVPLVLTTDPVNLPKASPDELWGQIMADLKKAIELMPAKKYNTGFIEEGHVDKWCAEALMARAFLFYTGYYKKSEVTLPGDGAGVITKQNVVEWLNDCIQNSGYRLITSDYRNLWAYSNKFTVNDYAFTKDKNLKWVEDDNAVNPESMFAIKFSQMSSWSTTIGYANQYALHFGLRGGQEYKKTFPFGQGWGAGPVSPNMWNDWVSYEQKMNGGKEDPRRKASITVVSDELIPQGYQRGQWEFIQETNYWEKKNVPVCAKNGDGYVSTFEYLMYPGFTEDNFQLNNIHDLVLIRFSDVLLMHSELTETADGMNQVRARVGLPAIAYSLENLQNERRFELCFEGVRWNDIRRWHIAEQVLEKQNNVDIFNYGAAAKNKAHGGGYAARYKATGGFFPLPANQISLSNGVLEQNPGWGQEALYSGW